MDRLCTGARLRHESYGNEALNFGPTEPQLVWGIESMLILRASAGFSVDVEQPSKQKGHLPAIPTTSANKNRKANGTLVLMELSTST